MIRIRDIKIREDLSDNDVLEYTCNKNKIKLEDVKSFRIFKKSIDARNKDDVFYVYTLDILLDNEEKYKKFEHVGETSVSTRKRNIDEISVGVAPLGDPNEKMYKYKIKQNINPIIVGAGPARIVCCINFCSKWY